jgi:hypothetical protein
MRTGGGVAVTLSGDLLDHLDHAALGAEIPLRCLVAGLVCDTVGTLVGRLELPRTGGLGRRSPARPGIAGRA